MQRTTLTAVALAVALVLAGAAAPTATAQTDDEGFVDGLFSDDDADWSERIIGAVTGQINRWTADTDDADAVTAADEFTTAFNENAASFEQYVNQRTAASTDFDVLAITFEIGDEQTTRYLVANVSDGNYTDTEVVASTDRTIDENCTLSGHAARSAASEVSAFHEEFVEEDRNVSERYLGRMAGEYRQDVSCSFLGGDDE